MNIKKMNIDMIRPYWRNPRKNDNAVEAVKKSIKKYGYNQPIVIDTDNVIIVGHTRYKALRELGYKDIAVVQVELSQDKSKQYRIADNKTGEKADWDEDLLLFELREVEGLEDMQIFFDDKELDGLIEINEEDFIDPFGEEEIETETQKVEEKVRAEMKEEMGEEYDKKLEEEKEEMEKKIREEARLEMEEKMREEARIEAERVARRNMEIKAKEEEQRKRFEKASEEKEKDYVEVECPYCEEKFILSKSKLLKS